MAIAAWLEGRWQHAQAAAQRAGEVNPETGEAIRCVSEYLAGGCSGHRPNFEALLKLLERLVDIEQYELFDRAMAVLHLVRPNGWKPVVGKLLVRKGFVDAGTDLLTADGIEAIDEEGLRLLASVAAAQGMREQAEVFLVRAHALASGGMK